MKTASHTEASRNDSLRMRYIYHSIQGYRRIPNRHRPFVYELICSSTIARRDRFIRCIE